MHFVTNKINTKSNVPTLSEIMKAARTKAAMEKGASTEEVKEAGRGKAENLTAPKFGPGGKPVKEENVEKPTPKGKANKKAETEKKSDPEEGESSGQPEAEAKLVNDPNKDPKLSEGNGGGSETKDGEGESSGQLDVEPLHQKGESNGEKPGDLETMKSDKKEAKTVANALKKIARFKSFAELTPKQKEFLRGVYSIYWPKEFIDALLEAK
jgi:hypothetical protein